MCPNEKCGKLVEKAPHTLKNICKCSCGQSFCFLCMKEDHEPATCQDIEFWKAKETDDDESLKYIKAFTKQCPKCKMPVSKVSGCTHMTCKCGCGFCWLCLTPNNDHSGKCCQEFKTNTYFQIEGKLTEQEKKMKEEQVFAERYKFHFERYLNHEKAKELLVKL